MSRIVEPIKRKLNEDCLKANLDADWTNEMVDTFLKHNFKLDKSKIVMSKEELRDLIEHSKQFAMQLDLDLDKGNGIELNFK